MKVIVATRDFRQALAAVAPHADPTGEIPTLHRVRVIVGDDVTVSATNGFSAAQAVVDVQDQEDGETSHFDLSPQQVKELMVVFKGPKPSDDLPPDMLRLEADEKNVVITDCGGLFPGKQLTLPRYPDEDNFPDMSRLIAAALTRHPEATDRLVTSPTLVGLFLKAGQAYGRPLVIDASGDSATLLITCGAAFIGLLAPQRPNDETTAEIAAWHRGWLDRLMEGAPA